MTDQETPERLVLGEGEHDITDDQYHADPCAEPSLNRSLAWTLFKRSPRHLWVQHPRLNPDFEPEEKESFDLGKAFHKMILGKGGEIEVLDFKDWRTDLAKRSRAEARAAGRIPMLKAQYDRSLAMTQAVRAQIPGWEELAYAMATGAPERVLIWVEETVAGPVWCRAQLDWRPDKGNLFPDWKSTEVGAGPEEWGAKTIWQHGGHFQAAFYARGIRKVLGTPDPALFFAVAELAAPHALACIRPVPAAVAMMERAVEYAIQMYGLCLHANRWPGYRRQMAWVEPPPWVERPFLEREERGEVEPLNAWAILNALDEGKDAQAATVEPDDDDPFGLPPIPEKDRIV